MADIVGEGKSSSHPYSLLDADGVTVESVEALKYKVSDGVTDLVPWTNLPLTGIGTIEVPGPVNRISSAKLNKRYLTIFAVHDGGRHLPEEIVYLINPLVGIDHDTVPTT